jgi:hypothetical protein
MNTNLDTFETALLAELKSVAAAAAPAPRRRGVRVAIGGAVAASLAGVVALGVTVLQPSAAFAVDETSTGAVVIRIHELSDTQGLEQALAAHGIKAVVNYDANATTNAPPPGLAPGGSLSSGGGTSLHSSTESGTASLSSGGAGTDLNTPDACGFGSGTPQMPFTSGIESSDYVITIPAGSPLLQTGRTLDITSSGAVSSGFSGLQVSWTDHGATCGAGTASASAAAN